MSRNGRMAEIIVGPTNMGPADIDLAEITFGLCKMSAGTMNLQKLLKDQIIVTQ